MNYFAGCSLIGIAMYIYIWLKYKQRNMMMTLGLVLSLVTLLVYVLAALKRSGIAKKKKPIRKDHRFAQMGFFFDFYSSLERNNVGTVFSLYWVEMMPESLILE